MLPLIVDMSYFCTAYDVTCLFPFLFQVLTFVGLLVYHHLHVYAYATATSDKEINDNFYQVQEPILCTIIFTLVVVKYRNNLYLSH